MKHMLLLAALLVSSRAGADPARSSEPRRVADFHAIKVGGVIEVAVTVGRALHVEVSGEADRLNVVTTEVKSGVLVIDTHYDHHDDHRDDHLKVTITVPALDALSVTGVGTVEVAGLANTRFDASVSGTGELSLAGTTGTLTIGVTGTGDVHAKDLATSVAVINVSGTGSVRANATRSLDANVSGAGEIQVYGHPASVKKTVSGVGGIEVH